MEILPVCRICLSTEASKDISDLKSPRNGKTCTEIMLFCLSIQVEIDSKVSTKLCLKCFRKIVSFYNFKLLALKSDAYLKDSLQSSSHIKRETLTEEDLKDDGGSETLLEDDLKNEGTSLCGSDVVEIPVSTVIKLEPVKDEEDQEGGCQSDDELLSVIKKIKYEFIPVDNETKENEHLTIKRGRKPKKDKSKTHICEECGKTVKDLKNHMRLHEPKDARKRIPCTLCDKTFSTHNARYKHNQNKHLGVKKTCPICSKAVFNLSQHNALSHNPSKLRFECVPCGRRFISPSARDAHMSVHTKDRPHVCDLCEKRFRTNLSLVLHKRQVHDKEKTHLCQFCSKSFFKKYHLQVHLRSHTKEKPYSCKQCGKSFSSSTILNNHVLTHSEEKTIRCTLCDASFVRQGYLRAHMLSHTREKRYPCKYCGMKYHRSDHRKRHEYTAHEKHVTST
ncbi:hypothetical protein ABMA28_014775 [Loxostege sticticalis]|uniref:Uncharacterized protein n=1 Tax=Loxostege sticticalis TaxID=481309 RepID=A0ABD0TC81_LOXSC